MTDINNEIRISENDISEVIELFVRQYKGVLFHDNPFTEDVGLFSSVQKLASQIPIVKNFIPSIDAKQQVIQKLLEEQSVATSFSKWYAISLQLDEILDNNTWKNTPESDLYDYEFVYNSLIEMRQARENHDYKLLLYLIRTKWVRNVGNIGDINLYKHSFVGTKKLIEDYIEECKLSLKYLVNNQGVNLDDRYLLGMLVQTRKNIGRTALVLSGGSTFGMFHIGVLVSLLEANLLPRIISGTLAGLIVASILSCHNNEENKLLIETLGEKEFNIFESSVDDSDSNNNVNSSDGSEKKKNQFRRLLQGFGHFLKYGTVFELEGLKRTVKGFVGDLTFREAYNRTGKILNVTVSPASLHEQTRLLNYLTAPNCLIWSAVCASCSVPGFFPSSSIYEKNPKTNKIQEWNNDSSIKFVDGSVDNDLPITRLLEMFNVDHIIAVQVNPHVVPILRVSINNPGGGVEHELTTKFKGVLNNVYDLFTSELIHFFQILNEMDIYKNLSTKIISLLSQSYSGDITILPNFKVNDFKKIFVNPTPEFIADFIVRGARATWPKMTLINNHCGVEFELDKAITLLRGRSITSHHRTSTFTNSLVVNPITPIRSNDEESPEKRRMNVFMKNVPKFKRNVSYSGTRKKQRNSSISNFQAFSTLSPSSVNGHANNVQSPSRQHHKSTTSLSSMSYTTPSKREINSSHRAHTDYQEKYTRSNDDTFRIRKARSSGNFESYSNDATPIDQRIKYQSDRVPNMDKNPYAETPNEHELDPGPEENGYLEEYDSDYDYDIKPYVQDKIDEASDNTSSKNDSYSKDKDTDTDNSIKTGDCTADDEKAYLPKRSQNNSLTNSYIGLNRLKDADLSKVNSNNSPNPYLKDPLVDKTLQLNSPDIRRTLTKKINEIQR